MRYGRLISFASVHHAIKGEKLLAAAGISASGRPTPRELSRSCGYCLEFQATDQQQVLALFAQEQVEWSKLFAHTEAGVYEKITEYGRTDC